MRNSVRVLVPRVPTFRTYKKYLKEMDNTRIYSNFGPLNSQLIERLADYFGVQPENVSTVANATLGIQGLIETAQLSTSDPEWFLPSWTFTATATALANSKNGGRFVDIDSEWRAKFPLHSEYLIDVAPFGDSIDIERLGKRKFVIVDAAPSFDSLKNIRLGNSFPVAVVVSLHATKLLPAGEGGVVVSNSPSWISEFKRWTNFGLNSHRNSSILGTNGKMSEIAAAVALASLDSWHVTRKRILDLRRKALEISHEFGFSCAPADEKFLATPYWILRTKSKEQTSLMQEVFLENGIETRQWWPTGLHKMAAFKDFNKYNLSMTEQESSRYLGLPFHFELTRRNFQKIGFFLENVARRSGQ